MNNTTNLNHSCTTQNEMFPFRAPCNFYVGVETVKSWFRSKMAALLRRWLSSAESWNFISALTLMILVYNHQMARCSYLNEEISFFELVRYVLLKNLYFTWHRLRSFDLSTGTKRACFVFLSSRRNFGKSSLMHPKEPSCQISAFYEQ